MNYFRPISKFSTLLLLVLTLHTLTHSFIFPSLELTALQEQTACTQFLTADDSNELADEDDCKLPKNSFVDYSTFLSPKHLVPVYNPSISDHELHDPLQTPPQVYLELVVPPDSKA